MSKYDLRLFSSPLNPADRLQILQHLLNLDKESLRCRFSYPIKNESLIKYGLDLNPLAAVGLLIKDFSPPAAVGVFDKDLCVGVAELHISDSGSTKGELAISIEKEHRGLGYSKKMMEILIERAKEEGLKKLFLHISSNNDPSLKLARSLNFMLESFDFGAVTVSLDI